MATPSYPELDSLRGLAALGVVYIHIRSFELFWYWTMMDFFFVLSAFLLTERLLLRELTPRTTLRFYMRRAQRIWPLYFASVVAIFSINEVAHRFAPDWGAARASLPQFLTFTQYTEMYLSPGDPFHSYFPDYVPYSQHLWSLAVEEQFYLLLPFTVAGFAFFQRTFPAAQFVAIAALLLLPLAARLVGFHFFLLVHHLDALVLGYVLARLKRSADNGSLQVKSLHRALCWLAAAALVGAIPYLYQGYSDCHRGGLAQCGSTPTDTLRALTTTAFNLLWFSLVGLTCLSTGSTGLRWLRLRCLILSGRMSYSLYVVHMPILFWTVPALSLTYGVDSYAGGLLCLPLILLVAYLVYHVFDARFQRRAPTRPTP